MGSDSSKEESRSSPEDSRRRIPYVKHQRRQEGNQAHQITYQSSPSERARAPYSYTTEHLHTSPKQDSPNDLERPRAPYNYTSEQLHLGSNRSPNLYPNLNVQEEYVYVQRPQPSAPPASEVSDLPKAPPRPTQSPATRSTREPPCGLLKVPPRPPPPNIPSTSIPLLTEISSEPSISPTTSPLLAEISGEPSVPLTTIPFLADISREPSIPPTTLLAEISREPSLPPTSPTMIPLLAPISIESSVPRTTVPLSHHVTPRSSQSQSSASPLSPNAPGPSHTNSSANKNRPRSAASTKNRNDGYSCSTCAQRLGITIYQCLGGHSCCKDCRFAGRACGTCHSNITDMRNITLEALMAELKNPCRNPGCTLSFNACDMERHLKECPFGEMDCPMGTYFGQCTTRCKVADMAAHFDACHKDQRTAEIGKEMYVFNICMETHKLFLVKNGPFNFIVHLKVHETERKISMVVQLLGTKISAGKWTYEFHVYNKRQPLRKYLYVDSCQSISTPVDDIFKEGTCATLPLSYGMTFVNESALTYKFFIKKELNQHGRKPRNNAAK